MTRPILKKITLTIALLLVATAKSYAVEFHECEKFVGKDESKHSSCLSYSFREAVTKSEFSKIGLWLNNQGQDNSHKYSDYLTLLMCDSMTTDTGETSGREGEKPFRLEDSREIIKVTDQLLDLGGSFYSMSNFSLVTPLFCLINRKNSVVLEHVLNRINPTKKYLNGSLYEGVDPMYVPLYRAGVNNDIASAKVLLKHGATVDHYEFQFRTAIIGALENHNVAFVNWLLDEGASVNQRDPKYLCSDKAALEYALEIPTGVEGRDGLIQRIKALTTIQLSAEASCSSQKS